MKHWHETEPTEREAKESDRFLAELLGVAERHLGQDASREGIQHGLGRFAAAVIARLYGPKAVAPWHFAQGHWVETLVDPGKAN